ncbi:MAG: PASTA domain-containing protein [Candidatus Korobacteraceae bacterium]|jgi:beta-lactam-binding protein with PASTA domain
MRLLRTLLYGLILIVVGLISALTAMRFAIHGREVSVPKLTGLTATEAQRVAGDSGLAISREQRFYSSDVPEGRIVSQLPQAGTRVRTGFLVRIAESRGPQKVEIPSLVGQSVRSAELNLKERGLELGSLAHLATANAAADQVIAQSPTPDAQQIATPSVSLLTSVAPAPEAFVMPNFVGSKLSEASAAIRVAGLAVGTIATAPSAQAAAANSDSAGTSAGTQPAGAPAAAKRLVPARASSDATITRQTPVAGQRVFPGNTVQFEIAAPAR